MCKLSFNTLCSGSFGQRLELHLLLPAPSFVMLNLNPNECVGSLMCRHFSMECGEEVQSA
jgi:hypothetical protein